MRETFTSGSVGRAPGNRCLYPEPDCLQRPLLRRSRFRQQVSASVRLPKADIFWSPACSGCVAGRDRRKETTMWLSTVAFSVTLTLGLFLAPDPSHAQAGAKTPRVGMLTPSFAPHSGFEGFRQ